MSSQKQGEAQKNLSPSQCNKNYSLSLDDFQFVKVSDFDHAFVLKDVVLNPTFGGFIVSAGEDILYSSPVNTAEALQIAINYLGR